MRFFGDTAIAVKALTQIGLTMASLSSGAKSPTASGQAPLRWYILAPAKEMLQQLFVSKAL